MIVSVNWLKKFTEITVPIDELATLIGARLVEIEEVIDLGAKYKDVIIAKVVECSDVPDSDHLHLCKIDDGGRWENVERDENGLIQVVCGAPNVRKDLLVAWLPPGSVVPETFASDPFVLGARKLRGFMSNGMIASMRELGLGDEHDGILEIDVPNKPGDSFAETYELDDYLLDIENKSLTHRPDCFGLVGLAREIAAIQGLQFTSPDWFTALNPVLAKPTSSLAKPTVKIADRDICARYEAIVLANADCKKTSPILIQSYLSRSGMRPISAAVDITNYLMLVTGQPLHAFDYDKFVRVSPTGKAEIFVRSARAKEKMTLLDGREIEMNENDIVICAGDASKNKPVALAGAMGGAETEIDANTKNILIESATFDLYRLRNTQMRHGIFSEAITRFTKGQPPQLTAPVLASAARMFVDQCSAEIATEIVDDFAKKPETYDFEIPLAKIAAVLGEKYVDEIIARTLQNVEFENVEIANSETLKCRAPWWRTDVKIDEDVIEEIGKINGFDNIAPTLPTRDFTAVAPTDFDTFRENLRTRLVRAGANEVLTYSFVHGDLLASAGQNSENAFRIANAISPDLQYYRLSILPSLLDKVNMNLRAGFEEYALFEIGKVHDKFLMDDAEPDVPAEFHRLAFVLANQKSADSAPYYHAKKFLQFTLPEVFASEVKFQPLPLDADKVTALAPFEPKRSAIIVCGEEYLGVVGEFRASVRKSFKLPENAAGFEIDLKAVFASKSDASHYKPLSKFPGTEKDICVQGAPEMIYESVLANIKATLANEKIDWDIAPVDIYAPTDESYKNITIRVRLTDREKTITTEEANEIVARVTKNITKINAKVV